MQSLQERPIVIPVALSSGSVEFAIEDITPERAQSYLNRNLNNRKLRQSALVDYSSAMQRGEWRLSPQGIAFDTQGRLMDGQHRLQAIIKSDVTVTMVVTRGWPAELFEVIDIGAKRTTGDMFTIRGETSAHLLASALGWLLKYDIGHCADAGYRPSPRQLEAVLERYPNIRSAIAPASPISRAKLLPPAIAAWLYSEFTEIDALLGAEFFKGLTTGAALKDDDVILILRNRLLSNASSQRRLPAVVLAAFTIKAWNAWYTGRPLHVFKFQAGEAFPAIEGRKPSRLLSSAG